MPEKTILFPTDFSTAGDAALAHAEALAKSSGARLLIVHVEEPPLAYGGGELYYGLPEPSSERILKMLEDVKPSDPSVPYTHRLTMGDPAGEVVRIAEEEGFSAAPVRGGSRSIARVRKFFVARAYIMPQSPQFGVVWDPCNCIYLDGTNDPIRDDFPAIAGQVIHVHFKDAKRDGSKPALKCVELGKGSIDFPAHLRDLKARGYRGWIALETHWRSIPLNDEVQHLPAGYSFSANAEPASRICMAHLQRWVAEA